MNTPSSAVRPSHDTPHAQQHATPEPQPQPWLLVPALFTALTLAAGGLSYSVSYLPRCPLWFSLPYLLPLGLAALTWRRPRTPAQRTNRIVAGSIGAGLALFCAKAVESVLFCLALALWLVHGD
ncbi:hypothetical protein ADK52_39165 [Streptomyces sp. WM6372]|uniref:hypothetical protein n=1 Tax=Streptomyces sp. WM6372 TaxID=1415555 RepID=UPI0006AE8030|nr:hypothetical protein [Streptomyces sp. WM6372]KOU12932.1 hypothetical protein ADK52_39165 [Streptomyces sp. WM6372]